MSLEYQLFSELEEGPVRDRSLEIARMYSMRQEMRLRGEVDGYNDALLRLDGEGLVGITFFHDYQHNDSDDRYLRTEGTFVEEKHRRKGAALELMSTLNQWAKKRGYQGIKTAQLNSKMVNLRKKMAQTDSENKYKIEGRGIVTATITF